MRFSIAIPAYKPDYLAEAVASVLAQTFSDWELVVVDDCSPADLRSIVAPFLADSRVRYYRNEKNIGAMDVVDNWNRCLDYCTGDYVICMGDDDRLLPVCLQELTKTISENTGYGVYHLRTELIDEEGCVIERLESRPDKESPLEIMLRRWEGRNQFIGDFCFQRQRLIANGGFFKLPLAWGADDLTVYLAAKGNNDMVEGIININVPLFQYRVNAQTLSSSSDYKLKMRAMRAYSDWFENELGEAFKPMIRKNFAKQAKWYIRQDVHSRQGNLFYWLKHREESRLPYHTILLQSIKGLIK